MAKRRDLKQAINYICSDLFAEGIAASLYGHKNGKDKEENNSLLVSILVLRNDFVRRISHLELGMKPRKYFNALISDFNSQVNTIVNHFKYLG